MERYAQHNNLHPVGATEVSVSACTGLVETFEEEKLWVLVVVVVLVMLVAVAEVSLGIMVLEVMVVVFVFGFIERGFVEEVLLLVLVVDDIEVPQRTLFHRLRW